MAGRSATPAAPGSGGGGRRTGRGQTGGNVVGSATGSAPVSSGAVLAGLALIILGWRVAGTRDPAAALRRLAGDILVGTAWVLAVNLAASPVGLHVGWNPVTALIAGALGLPGVAALVVLAARAMAFP